MMAFEHDGAPCCVVGVLIAKAGLNAGKRQADFCSIVGSAYAISKALGMHAQDTPVHLLNAVHSIENHNDNVGQGNGRKRLVADSLDYFADVLKHTELPPGKI